MIASLKNVRLQNTLSDTLTEALSCKKAPLLMIATATANAESGKSPDRRREYSPSILNSFSYLHHFLKVPLLFDPLYFLFPPNHFYSSFFNFLHFFITLQYSYYFSFSSFLFIPPYTPMLPSPSEKLLFSTS